MSNYQMQMPAQYTSIGDDEMVLLCGGETTAWQTFQDIGRVLNYVARIFSVNTAHAPEVLAFQIRTGTPAEYFDDQRVFAGFQVVVD